MKSIERATLNTAKAKLSAREAEHQAEIEKLRKLLPPGATVYTVVKHVARGGMMRHIAAIAVLDGKAVNISHTLCRVLGWIWTDDDAIKVWGAGMDMCFHLTYKLAEVLYGDGYKLENRCL